MDQNLPDDGTYILTTEIGSVTFTFGRLRVPGHSDTIGIFPQVADPQAFTFTKTNDAGEYSILIGDQCLDEKNGWICFKTFEANNACKIWRVVLSENGKYMIKGSDNTRWSAPSFEGLDLHGMPIRDSAKCQKCSKDCKCNEKHPCEHPGGCPACAGDATTAAAGMTMMVEPDPDCTVCPPSCLEITSTPVSA